MSVLAVAAPASADCPLDLGRGTGWVIFSEHSMIAFRPEPLRIEAGQPFSLLLNVCTRNGNAAELLALEAEQAEEGRHMKAKATVVSAGDGRFRAEGLVLDATGRWELTIDVRSAGENERLTHEIIVK